ncbi:MAG: hypothetical protein JWQ63_1266 [Mucilaginibacter sp.]|nr:hypothetical protein [Mucilaginibacter sp.]
MYFTILLIMTISVVIISKKSAMLRTEIFNIANFQQLILTQGIKNPRPSFSLGRTQLAFWTVIIISSFIYTVYVHSTSGISVPAIDPVNLVLLGIAGGTTAVAKVIDSSQKNNQGDSISQQDYPSEGFFRDLISDEKGVSIHRLQNVIWTIIVGFIYISAVFDKKVLPDQSVINNQLLGLMGVSAGAYLGLKTCENKTAPVSPVNVNAGTIVNGITSNISEPAKSVLTLDKQGTL